MAADHASARDTSPAGTSAGYPSLPTIFLALTPFSLSYLFSYLYRAANAVVSGDLVAELGLSPSELGLLTATYLVTFAAFQLPLGVLLDRYGPRRVQASLVFIGAIGALLFALGRDLTTLAIGRSLIGIAFSGGLMSSFKAVVIWIREPRRALANACLMSVGGLGLLIATTPLEMATRLWGWRETFVGLSAVTFAVSALIFLAVPERSVATGAEPLSVQFRQVGRIYRDRIFLAMAPLLATTAGTHIGLQTLWAAPWLRDINGLDRSGVANGLFVMATAFAISILLAGVVTDRLVRRGYSLLTIMVGFQVVFLVAQTGIVLNPSDPVLALVLWSLFGMTGHVAVIAYPWLAAYFGIGLSGRSNTAANLLMFLWAFIVQYGAGAIIGLFPRTPGGGYAPAGYQAAIGLCLAIELLSLLWFLANVRRFREAENNRPDRAMPDGRHEAAGRSR